MDVTQNKSKSKVKFTFGKTKRQSFIDEKVKRNISPGIGSYKNSDAAIFKLSKSPSGLGMKRH